MSLVRSSATIGALTLVSRVLGLVRDTLMSGYLGAGLASDAFNIAWRLPNLFRALFAEGAFASAFVPMFNRKIGDKDANGHEDMAAALAFAENALSVLFPVLVLVTGVMMLATVPIVMAITGGFPEGGKVKFDLTVVLTRIMFPYLGLISLVSLLGGILNSLHRFWVNAAAPVLLNICMIASLLFFRGSTPAFTAQTQALAVTVSGVVQLLWLIWSCRQAGVVLRLRAPKLSADVKQLLMITWPTAIGAGAMQFNQVISTALAGRFLPQGSVTWLYFADRLYQIPMAMIGIGVGTAILPTLSRQIRSGNEEASQHTQNRAIELCLLLSLPAAAALMISAVPITRGLFQHGAFHALDTQASAAALAAYALGVPAYVLIKVLTPGFYARQDTRTPVRIALLAMVINLIGNIALIWPLRHVGIALSTSLAAWINVVLLYGVLHLRNQLRLERRVIGRAARLTLAAIVMSALLFVLNPYIDHYMVRGVVIRGLWLGLLIVAGGGVFAAFGFLFRAFSMQELKAQLTRGG